MSSVVDICVKTQMYTTQKRRLMRLTLKWYVTKYFHIEIKNNRMFQSESLVATRSEHWTRHALITKHRDICNFLFFSPNATGPRVKSHRNILWYIKWILYAIEPHRLRSFIKLCQGVLRSSSTLVIINHKCQAYAFIDRPIHLRLVDVDPGHNNRTAFYATFY